MIPDEHDEVDLNDFDPKVRDKMLFLCVQCSYLFMNRSFSHMVITRQFYALKTYGGILLQ
jgi:hypothetical protein